MSRFLTGTHALVSVPSREDMKATGIRASVSLCYGPGDENAITNINYGRRDGILGWYVPHVESMESGKTVSLPVFRGELFEKITDAANRALKAVKNTISTPEWGKTYRVFGSPDGSPKVEEVPQ